MEYRSKDTLVDLYAILGLKSDVSKKSNCDEIIHKAYIEKSRKVHPDKHPGNETASEVYQLITSAYDVLKTASGRAAYDNKKRISDSCFRDHFALRKQSEDHVASAGKFSKSSTVEGDGSDRRAIDSSTEPNEFGYFEPSEEMKKAFNKRTKVLDQKRGMTGIDQAPLSSEALQSKMDELLRQRELDNDYKPPVQELLKTSKDPKVFNAIFELTAGRGRAGHHTNPNPHDEVMEYQGAPSGWEDHDHSTFVPFSEDSTDDPFDDTAPHEYSGFASIDMMRPVEEIEIQYSDLDLNKYDKPKFDEAYYEDIMTKIQQRVDETKKIEKMKLSDFSTSTHGYGITDDPSVAGYMSLPVDDDDIVARYQKLTSASTITSVVDQLPSSSSKKTKIRMR
jgi:curved DNA-binding protein CbpA